MDSISNSSITEYPLVSVIVLCYNQAKFVEETLNSILSQTYPNIQLIITDDASKDNSVDIIRNWIKRNNANCIFIDHQENKGICKTLNEALSFCNGKYIQEVASDDILLPDKIKTQVEVLENSNDQVALVFSDAYMMDENGNWCIGCTKYISYTGGLFFQPPKDFFRILLSNYYIPAPAVLYKHKCLKEIGYYDEGLTFEDLDIVLRLSKRNNFIYSFENYTLFRTVLDSFRTKLLQPLHLESHIKILLKHINFNDEVDHIIKNKLFYYLKLYFKVEPVKSKKYIGIFFKKYKLGRILNFSSKLPFFQVPVYNFLTKHF